MPANGHPRSRNIWPRWTRSELSEARPFNVFAPPNEKDDDIITPFLEFCEPPEEKQYWWTKALDAMIEAQGQVISAREPLWRITKRHAREILDEVLRIGELLLPIEEELRTQGLEQVIDNILELASQLEKFDAIFNAQIPGAGEPHFLYEDIRTRLSRSRENRMREISQKRAFPATLIAVVSITTILAIIPMGFAWSVSSNEHGSSQDPDFYIQIQSSMMTALGIFTALYPTFGHPDSHSKRWSQVFAAIGIFCAVAAIPMYLKLPVTWTYLVAFASTAVQASMTVQLSVLADQRVPHLKKD